jgi:hypothetical protein
METLVSGGGAQVTTSLRDFVEAAYPEAVARRRAEELKALATSELHELAPGGGTHPALVQVGCAPRFALRRSRHGWREGGRPS